MKIYVVVYRTKENGYVLCEAFKQKCNAEQYVYNQHKIDKENIGRFGIVAMEVEE